MPDLPPPPAHPLDHVRNVKRLWRGFLALLVLTVAAEFVLEMHPHFGIDGLFAFHAAFGFLACAAMILVAKALARWLKRPDSYYGRGDD